MELADRYPDLAPLTKGSSFNQLFQLFWTLAQVRYATHDQLRAVNFKLATKKKLAALTGLGYLSVNSEAAFFTTDKCRELLQNQGYNTDILQTKLQGKFTVHELKIAPVILDLMKSPEFYAVFYPTFTEPPDYSKEWLRPDACIVWKRPDAYKIQFLEVEEEKGNWEDYLLRKKAKYDTLASTPEIFTHWWKVHSEKLKLPYCSQETFCFSVRCYGNQSGEIQNNWPGWKFV